MNKSELKAIFINAKATGAKYIGVSIQTEGSSQPEIIINPNANFDAKFDYYMEAYDDDLILIAAKGKAESARVVAENARVKAESARETAENKRQENENTRIQQEQQRQQNTSQAVKNTNDDKKVSGLFMKRVVFTLILAAFIFTVVMIFVFLRMGSEPSTLIENVFRFLSVEGGAMALIKSVKTVKGTKSNGEIQHNDEPEQDDEEVQG